MKLGYARISKSDGSQTLDLQMDALAAAGVEADHIYQDEASGKRDARPGLDAQATHYMCGSLIGSDGT